MLHFPPTRLPCHVLASIIWVCAILSLSGFGNRLVTRGAPELSDIHRAGSIATCLVDYIPRGGGNRIHVVRLRSILARAIARDRN